jgi:hypothetical protein
MIVPGTQSGESAQPEDAWLMRFLDITVQPGHVYRYRVRLKVANPNYRRDVKELAMPKFAEDEFLESTWFELPDAVSVPSDEFVYAAATDDRNRRVTEKYMAPGTPEADALYLQMQQWADYVRPKELPPRGEPIGDWLVADIKAYRGQMVGEMTKLKLPLWSMVAGAFVFREPPAPRTFSILPGMQRRPEPTWTVDFTPVPQMLLVDFEGGSGTYIFNRRQVQDQAGVDVLMLSDDGKLFVRRSQADIADPDRRRREETWKQWLEKIQVDTDQFKNQGLLGNPPGGPPGGGNSNNPNSTSPSDR